MALPQLRAEVLSKCDLYQVLLAFGFQLDRKEKEAIDKIREVLPGAGAKQLRNFRDLLAKEIRRTAKALGCRRGPELFYHHFVENQFKGGFSYAYVPKYILEQMFAKWGHGVPEWNSFPAQTLIGFDFAGEYEQVGRFEFYLPEIALYEDMCFAYNNAVPSQPRHQPGTVDKLRIKAHKFYVRTAVLSAFYFVEAYLNGIAFDFYFRTRGDRKLSQDELDRFNEYDSHRNRERWVSFRDKMLQYPKIIVGAKEPPLTEVNCQEVKVLASEAKALRDSLVHNSPKFGWEDVVGERRLISGKVRSMLHMNLEEATQIVDAAVSFTKRVNALLQEHGHGQKLDWLYERDETGVFPARVFE